ncbi:MAG: hypothetical protein AB7U76_25020 [Pirellulales bacterium]
MATNTTHATPPARQLYTPQVHYMSLAITYADNGSTLTVGTIPAGAYVLRGGVAVTTAFNGNSANTVDIGTASDTDGFATALALGTIGVIVADEMATSNDFYVTSETVIKCVVTSTASASAGAGLVWIEYIIPM